MHRHHFCRRDLPVISMPPLCVRRTARVAAIPEIRRNPESPRRMSPCRHSPLLASSLSSRLDRFDRAKLRRPPEKALLHFFALRSPAGARRASAIAIRKADARRIPRAGVLLPPPPSAGTHPPLVDPGGAYADAPEKTFKRLESKKPVASSTASQQIIGGLTSPDSAVEVGIRPIPRRVPILRRVPIAPPRDSNTGILRTIAHRFAFAAETGKQQHHCSD
jgi:hypothetical protein